MSLFAITLLFIGIFFLACIVGRFNKVDTFKLAKTSELLLLMSLIQRKVDTLTEDFASICKLHSGN